MDQGEYISSYKLHASFTLWIKLKNKLMSSPFSKSLSVCDPEIVFKLFSLGNVDVCELMFGTTDRNKKKPLGILFYSLCLSLLT